MSWGELVALSAAKLQSAGIADHRLNAELLAAHVLGVWKRSEVEDRSGLVVSQEDISFYDSLLERRLRHEPLQHVIGETEFFGLRILSTRAALIPRADTEILVEEALKEAQDFANTTGIRILDIGTGSGAIALALASHLPNAAVVGIDVSADAIGLAEQNRDRLGLTNVSFLIRDVFDRDVGSNLGGAFDMIVSNPPYVSKAEMDRLESEIVEFEPRIALTDELDGLTFYRRILDIAPRIGAPNGRILLELSFDGAQAVASLFKERRLSVLRLAKDLSGNDRVIVGNLSTNV